MNVLRALPIAAALALAAGCETPTGVSDGVLTVSHTVNVLSLRNASPAMVNYLVIESDLVPLIDWIPLAGPGYPNVPAGSTVGVPYASITGYKTGSTQAYVYWWHAVPDGAGGYTADSVRLVVAAL